MNRKGGIGASTLTDDHKPNEITQGFKQPSITEPSTVDGREAQLCRQLHHGLASLLIVTGNEARHV
jgi:hypothetical protein